MRTIRESPGHRQRAPQRSAAPTLCSYSSLALLPETALIYGRRTRKPYPPPLGRNSGSAAAAGFWPVPGTRIPAPQKTGIPPLGEFMTVVVLWHSKKSNQLFCVADTRISRNNATATDHGPKILPVPVVCHRPEGGPKWKVIRRTTFGFAYCGSTLSAIGTHSIASACTQHLAGKAKEDRAIPLEEVAQLFRSIGEDYVRDVAGRLGPLDRPESTFFDGMIFGYCHASKQFRAFVITSSTASGIFRMNLAELLLNSGAFHPMGSGVGNFLSLHEELEHSHPNPGVLTTFGEMIARQVQKDVGGHAQLGVTDQRDGFRLLPILNPGTNGATLSFLGWELPTVEAFTDFRIGYNAFKIDPLWDNAKGTR